MSDEMRTLIQHAVGWIAALSFLGLAYLSMAPNYELTWPVIIGSVLVIAMLLGKLDSLADVIEKWRGGR